MTVFHEFFDATAGRFPTRVALGHRDRDYSYAEVQERSVQLAAALSTSGIRRGDRVATYVQKCPEVILTALACSRLGAILVPVNPLLKSRQLIHVLADSGARMMLSASMARANVEELLRACPELRTIVDCEVPGAGASASVTLPFNELLLRGGTLPPSTAIDRDPAAILYTSGSTGRPKGVVVSHRNLVSGAHSVSTYLKNTPEDRLLAVLPLSFDYGFSQVSTAFAVGACAVLSNFSTATALIQEIGARGITGLAGVPTMWAHLATSEWPSNAVASLRYITNSGGALAPAVIRKLQARLPKTSIYCMYGLTEAFRSTYLDPEQLPARMGSIGKAIPNQEVLVLRPDGSRCDPGEPGELVHRGSLVTLGYWNDAELTHQRFRPLPAFNAGLMEEIAVWSGDLVRTDEEGYLYFIGRKDDLIKTSGHRVSPSEIEEVALEVPGVVEAVAVGVPDDVLGQAIALAVVAEGRSFEALAEAVRQHVRMQLPSYMVPAHIHCVTSVPRSPNGKVDRNSLLQQLQATDLQAVSFVRGVR